MPIPDGSSSAVAERVPVYILAGGESRRFGRDKARVRMGGTPLVVRIAETLGEVAARTTVVARDAARYDDLGLRTIGDLTPGKGPIGGLLAALDDVGGNAWILLSACDWIGIQTQWARTLLAARRDGTGAVVFRTRERREPLFSLYHTDIRSTVAEQIDSGSLAMHELLDRINVVTVAAPHGWAEVTNLNHPSDAEIGPQR